MISKFLALIYKIEVQSYELTPISHKQFNKFVNGKDLKEGIITC